MAKKKKGSLRSVTKHLAAAIKSKKLQLPEGYSVPEKHGHQDRFTSIREATYRGKVIRVETTYRITIDGEPVTAHTQVLDDGTVHSHAFQIIRFAPRWTWRGNSSTFHR